VLCSIKVQNFALIDQADLSFHEGFTAITGETGSGKSILLGAIGLLLGQRAESKIFRNNDQKCIIEASFDIDKNAWMSFFEQFDLDIEDQIHIRREILPNGKSRSFINDTPVALHILKVAGEWLVDIHSQHGQSLIGKRSFQLEVLDMAGNCESILERYRQQFDEWQNEQTQLKKIQEQRDQWLASVDFIQFQLDEMEKIGLVQLDVSQLEAEATGLQHAEEIQSSGEKIHHMITQENGLNAQFNILISSITKTSEFHPVLAGILERLKSCQIELNDIASEAADLGGDIENNPQKLSDIQEKLGEIYRLQQKHRVQTTQELLALQEQWQHQLDQYQNVDDQIETLIEKVARCEQQLMVTGELLHQRRSEAAEELSSLIIEKLQLLSMEHAQLQIELNRQPPSLDGITDIRFMFTANKGSMALPIGEVASGGEISRVMLAIKSVLSLKKSMPVLILDEIDQGVSGEVAKKIGQLLQSVSHQMQIIAITHLPQVAAKANHHFKVRKDHSGERTITIVESLSAKERIQEIAEMLSGQTPTASAIANAEDLLKV
jgi:DNA repair protein RecN (Recombination protein N)